MKAFLSQLPALVGKKKKRVGRGLGSNRGAKSGRGTTRHQKARQSIPIHFEGGQGRMVKRFPLLRGKGKNKSKRVKPVAIPAAVLERFDAGATVDIRSLAKQVGLSLPTRRTGVKLVGKLSLKKKLLVKLPVSRAVKKIIEDNGGQVEPK
ncbi:uL15 family ribosomal protein [Patescibacteria group bacterium]|nr:uL15 family ribosomal protein [Patescibacteria group bacterium]MCL5091687.1 uL15 family ribosomal protein [Patescibacteria group bacterium]